MTLYSLMVSIGLGAHESPRRYLRNPLTQVSQWQATYTPPDETQRSGVTSFGNLEEPPVALHSNWEGHKQKPCWDGNGTEPSVLQTGWPRKPTTWSLRMREHFCIVGEDRTYIARFGSSFWNIVINSELALIYKGTDPRGEH